MRDLLVVDGEPGSQDVLRANLGRSCRITWTSTRHDALATLSHRAIDLVVLETRLPDGCGLELLSEIKGDHPGLPVIVITGHGSEAVCARALKLGARDYFTKPVAPAELLRSVRLILSVRSPQTHPRSNVLSPPAPSQAIVPRTGHSGVNLAVRVIHEQCEKKLTLGAIARAAETGLFSLSRNFTAVMGTSFRTYLLRVRVERAVEFLKDRSLSVAEVAERVGFPDPSWFNKVFKRHQGVSPSVYRKRRSARRTRS